jgi:hypothetical protein
MTLTIKASWIKETREGRNDNWGYNYKELFLSDNPAHIAYIRIPINAPGIKAIEYNADGGIANEYEQVYIDNDGGAKCLHHCTTTLFDIRYADADRSDKLTAERDALVLQCERDSQNSTFWEDVAYKRSNRAVVLEATIKKQEAENIALKAKIYDLMTNGASLIMKTGT